MRPPLLLLPLLTGILAAQEFDHGRARLRFKAIDLGDYMLGRQGKPLPNVDDFELCLKAFELGDAELRGRAAATVGLLLEREFFADLPAARKRQALSTMLRMVMSEDVAEVEGAVRGLRRLHRWPAKRLTTRIAGRSIVLESVDPRVSLMTEADRRQLLAQAVALIGNRGAVERRRLGALLAGTLTGGAADQDDHTTVAVQVLGALREPDSIEDARIGEVDVALRALLTRLRVRSPELAARIVTSFEKDLARGGPYGGYWNSGYDRGTILNGFGRNLRLLVGEQRARVFRIMVDGLGDSKLTYMLTSGERSPRHHRASEALEEAAAALTPDERAKAVAAVRAARAKDAARGKGKAHELDIEQMYRGVYEALGLDF